MSTGPDKHGVADATPCECDYGFQSNAITKAKECMPPDAWGAWDPVTKLPRVGCLDSVNRADHARFKDPNPAWVGNKRHSEIVAPANRFYGSVIFAPKGIAMSEPGYDSVHTHIHAYIYIYIYIYIHIYT